mmetsp:Transcript_23410/g.32704  ORF Transcript_23410/g.32704 Transcript_23410/m.32704 type:complete len:407 (+) Transcript_23410:69-1289(+)
MDTKLLLLIFFFSFASNCFAKERTYYIAADEVVWDYAPTNMDGATGMYLNETTNSSSSMMNESPATWTQNGPSRIGKQYKKVLYREYTDSSFATLKNRTSEWEHLGYLGPVIRAEVGDTIKVVFRNNGQNPYSMHPHGVLYDKQNEGVPNDSDMKQTNVTDGNRVMPGMEWTYTWKVPERSGPSPEDPSSIIWMYHSHVDEVMDVNSGLVGPIVITRSGAAESSGKAKDVDREFVLMYTIIDENLSWYLDENMMTYLPDFNQSNMETLKMDEDFQMSNMKHSVNGYLFSNLPGLSMMVNEKVRWYVISIGNENDLHGTHWHGQTLIYDGHRVDVIELIPASMKTLDMKPDNPGEWMVHCHTNHHISAGMIAMFDVMPSQMPSSSATEIFSSNIQIMVLFISLFLMY